MPHLTAFEKEALLELTVKYRHLVENKKTDATSTKEKTRGWLSIEGEFNALPNTTRRPWPVLKKSWENIKHSARKANRSAMRYSMGTGGGGPSTEVVDPFLSRVDTLMPHVNLRMSSEFDSDGFLSRGRNEEPLATAVADTSLSTNEILNNIWSNTLAFSCSIREIIKVLTLQAIRVRLSPFYHLSQRLETLLRSL